MSFTETQQLHLSEALEDLPNAGSASDSSSDSGLFAVRSSAPQEDLAGASFAGVYDSVLGVTPGGLAKAVRTVFVSVTPDEFVVDKVAGRVLDIKPGAKETALWSRPEGGSAQKPGEDSNDNRQCARTEAQALEVARLADRVETKHDW